MGRKTFTRHIGHVICVACGGLRSIDDPDTGLAPDRCTCTMHAEDIERWGPESVMPCMLCASCGLAIASGHSRWRQFHCDSCAPRARRFNERAHRLVVPMGVHSIVNQVRSARRQQPDLADALNLQRDLSAIVREHTAAVTRRHLEITGLDRYDEVELPEYVAACRAAGLDNDHVWNWLIAALR